MHQSKLLIKKDTGEKFVWTETLAARSDMQAYIGALDEKVEVHRKVSSDVVSFHLSALGIGDAISGLYAACGIANTGRQVQFHVKHMNWLPQISHPNLEIVPEKLQPLDANINYRKQLAAINSGAIKSRPHWYIQNVAQAYGFELCDPARPKEVAMPQPSRNGKYVVLVPFSSHGGRDWLYTHYRRLAIGLMLQGVKVIALCAKHQSKGATDAFYGLDVEIMAGEPANAVASVVAHASVVVANDSGMAHIAGLFGATCLALVSQIKPEALFECAPSVRWVVPETSCALCHNLPENGWDHGCNWGCSSLQSISPDGVIQKVLELYEAT